LTLKRDAQFHATFLSNLIYSNHRAKTKHYIFRKFLIIKISSTISALSDCLLFSKTRPDDLKTRSEVAELTGTPSKDFVSKESCGNIKECLFHHSHNASSFENEIFLLI
jgi:hypothetical protein